MQNKKHKKKVSRIVIFTSDAVDAKTRQFRLHPFTAMLLTLVLCGLVGAIIGYAIYEGQIWDRQNEKVMKQAEIMASLEEEKNVLEVEIENLNAKIEALSTAVNEKSQTADELQEELTLQFLPTDYPLTGSAGIEEVTAGYPMVIFTASEGVTVVASAKGTVTAIEQDETYGNKVTVDHGNGYVSIYCNKGEPQVKVGDEVAKGTTLYLIGVDNKEMAYQILKDGSYINPTEMLSING
ncbi:MAG TPA: peptidoglycan DD-metalloendopeptidase family protein [Lachnospiraceae bacterium]|nr:peptidoglycan DD-metalloendopeptidase family protein [Lachnospiraceae bacterium]